jgi:hypothetical protein
MLRDGDIGWSPIAWLGKSSATKFSWVPPRPADGRRGA